MQKLRWLAILMGITILGITGFQLYWLNNNYDREKQSLELKTSAAFRQTLMTLQASKMKLEKVLVETGTPPNRPVQTKRPPKKVRTYSETSNIGDKEPPITMINLLQEKMREYGDTGSGKTIIITQGDTVNVPGRRGSFIYNNHRTVTVSGSDSVLKLDPRVLRQIDIESLDKEGKNDRNLIAIHRKKENLDSVTKNRDVLIDTHIPGAKVEGVFEQRGTPGGRGRDAVFQFLYSVDSISIKDSVTLKELHAAFSQKLDQEKLDLSFSVSRVDSAGEMSDDINEVTVGFVNPITYRLSLNNKVTYILKQLKLPILFSFFLVGLTIASFVLLYRSLLKQRRLAELKNQFISNITHELKTPIATVGVAIEALKNFNAIHDPERTREYLDISQSELQRLSLLVDKVLKLSMFEKQEMELKKEQIDCRQLIKEVLNSMKLQFEKFHATVKLHIEGTNFIIEADKLHITSVIYNLVDNALKYSKENPVIEIRLSSFPSYLELSVKDNGIGIEPAYKNKIFEKFFRVPTGDQHNIKGYGLGLSYVAEVIRRHQGEVFAESVFGQGSTFTTKMPYAASR
ncbi:MAG: HAMP domain-containing histidine kinase [Chitinophagaceae bacterium]|nr:HAMP domain-containing histidine kinase [Chitinophagaceae bacterium]